MKIGHALAYSSLLISLFAACSDDGPAAPADTAEADTTVPTADTAPAPTDTEAPDGDTEAPPPDVSGDTSSPVEATTWHGHIRPLVERHCGSCHAEGAVGGFAMDDYDAIAGLRPLMVGRVLSGEMPPWPMDPECRDVQDPRFLTDAEKALFAAWKDGGYTEGAPADYAPLPARVPDSPDVGPSDLVLTRDEAYTPNRAVIDDYRCFIYDHDVTEDLWISGANVLPDAEAIVHHVLVYVVPPNRVSNVETRDANAPGLGYPCLGGVGARGDEALLAGWVPGMLPMHFPAGSAFRVEAGSKFVAQMHYNTLNFGAEDAIPADATQIELWQLPSGDEPERSVQIVPIADGDLDITAGSAEVVEGIRFTSPASGVIIGVIPHMHLLGTSISLTVERGLTSETECLARIPVWDFHWQQVYQYRTNDHVPLYFGDTIALECVYDNSAANQPVVDGERQAPRDVAWGEGTLDEMCLAYLVTTAPWGGAASGTCPGASDCIRDCAEGDALCPVQCLGLSGNDCASCAIQPLFTQCGQDECPLELLGLGVCIDGCSTPDNVLGCAVNECREQLDTLYACLEGPMRAGACDDELARCDVQIGTEE